MSKELRFWAMVSFVSIFSLQPVFAAHDISRIPNMAPIKESSAFLKLQKRGVHTKTIIMYLIDRFEFSGAQIVYNGYSFDARFSAGVARWFFSKYYQGQSPEEWILKWCNRSFPGNQLIKVKTLEGQEFLSRDILLTELDDLNLLLEEPKPAPALPEQEIAKELPVAETLPGEASMQEQTEVVQDTSDPVLEETVS